MSILTAQEAAYSPYQKTQVIYDFFSLFVNQSSNTTSLIMRMHVPIVNTKDLPATNAMLQKYLPSIYTSMCFNDKNYPFAKEVLSTEIGHLFEHILLEYLCQLKVLEGASDVTYEGETHWNWKRDPRGTFHIEIKVGRLENKIFTKALTKSTQLLSLIFENNKKKIDKSN